MIINREEEKAESLANEASLADNRMIEHMDCEACMEDYMFLMRDNYHEFFLPLTTILQCLSVAEKEGVLPAMGAWWNDVKGRYEY